MERGRDSGRWERTVLGDLIAETFGTFLLVAFGDIVEQGETVIDVEDR